MKVVTSEEENLQFSSTHEYTISWNSNIQIQKGFQGADVPAAEVSEQLLCDFLSGCNANILAHAATYWCAACRTGSSFRIKTR